MAQNAAHDTSLLENLVRVGTVSSVDLDNHTCRVMFKDTGITSGVLKVLNNRPYSPDYYEPDYTELKGGGSGDPAYESHKHEILYKQWMPKVDDVVLVLYVAVQDGDGYVLGGIP